MSSDMRRFPGRLAIHEGWRFSGSHPRLSLYPAHKVAGRKAPRVWVFRQVLDADDTGEDTTGSQERWRSGVSVSLGYPWWGDTPVEASTSYDLNPL